MSDDVLRRLQVLVALVVVGVIGGSLALSRYTEIRTEAGPERAGRVVLFAVPGLSLDDLDEGLMPNLDRMASNGSIAVANIRIQSDSPNLVGAYGSLGAGNRTRGTDADVLAFPSDAPWGKGSVRELVERRLDKAVSGDILLPLLEPVAEGLEPDGGTSVGALGDALTRAGLDTAVVSNATRETNPYPGRSSPAALAVADSDGAISTGSVGDELLATITDYDGVERVVADPDAYVAAVVEAQKTADLVVVDPGDTTRALDEVDADSGQAPRGEGPSVSTPTEEPDPGEEDELPDPEDLRVSALQRTDALLGQLRRQLRPGTLLMVVGVTPPGGSWALTPVVVSGPRVPAGYLESTSTHRPALVTLTDIAPTILELFGVEVPAGMIGQPLRYRATSASWSEARRLDDLLESRSSADRVMTTTFVTVQVALYGVVCLFLLRRRNVPRRLHAPMEVIALACGAWPAATFLLRMGTSLYSMGMGTFALSWLLALVVGFAARHLRAHPLDPVLAISALTVVTIVGDLATGAHLQVGSFFGYTPHTAPRFVGLGNSGFAILAGATIALVTALVARSRNKEAAWWVGAGVVVLVIAADGAPWMGADVGGILALVPVLGLMLWALKGRQVRWSTLLIAGVAGVAVLALAVGFEALRDPGDRTHIGRFFLGAGDGGNAFDTIRRKWDTNTRTLREVPLTWLIPALAAFGMVTARRSPVVQRALPDGSPQRIGVVATLAVGLLGWLVNDSGIIVAALACVQLGPYLVLLTFRSTAAIEDEPVPAESAALPAEVTAVAEPDSAGDHVPSVSVLAQMGAARTSGDAETPGRSGRVVAIVPAKDRADSVADTVRALLAVPRVDAVLVVDDGSTDDTAAQAVTAGADVLRLAVNRGKGGAVLAGVEHTPDAEYYLLIDADLARTASAADLLLDPVLAGEAEMTVGSLPPAGGKAGFGTIKKMSAKGIKRACGLAVRAPLSGQRAVRAEFVRGLTAAERFGLEVAMTIDVVRAGGRVLEVDVPMDHRHTGRSLSGFAHRGRQGLDILRALWPRVVPAPLRVVGLVAAVFVFTAVSLLTAGAAVPDSAPPPREAERVLIIGVPGLGLGHLSAGSMPNLFRLAESGSYGLVSPRTGGQRSPIDAYSTIGGGDRVSGGTDAVAAMAFDADLEGASAAEVAERRTGTAVKGAVVVTSMAGSLRSGPTDTNSAPGALGDALHTAGLTTAVVGTSALSLETQPVDGSVDEDRLNVPAAMLVADSTGSIDAGDVSDSLLRTDPNLPFGIGIDESRFVTTVLETLDQADVVVADPGEVDRATAYQAQQLPAAASASLTDALERTDRIIGAIADDLPPGTRMIVTGVSPPRGGKLVPMVVVGEGLEPRITSPSTRRHDLVTITDIAPTVLAALGVDVPDEMIGQAIEFESGRPDRAELEQQEDLINGRDEVYGGLVDTFSKVIVVLYLAAGISIVKGLGGPRFREGLRLAALVTIAWPLATFLIRAVPALHGLGGVSHLLVWVIAAAIAALASTRRSHPLDPLLWVAGATFVVLTVDLASGANLQVSSYLGYTPSVAARFVGIGNAASGVYIGATLLTAALVVARSGGRVGAWWSAAAVAAVAVVVEGAPWLGSDVGGIITLVPAAALVVLALAGYRLTWQRLIAIGAVTGVALAAAIGVEALRPVADRTHIGTFFLGGDQDEFWTTISRKWEVNMRLITSSTWRLFILSIGGFAAVVLAFTKRWSVAAPPGSAERAAIIGLAFAAVIGGVTNDSGALVASLVLCFLGPLIVFLSHHEPPELIPALPPSDQPRATP